jgi:N-acetylmuramoyl-L-alanine amidase
MLYRLYAVNKFIEDNEIDIAIHIHLNDYAGRNISEGKYKGFSLFVPDNSLRNGKVSQELAKYIAKTLDDNFKYSNNPLEKKKIILGHELIANGANNTIQAASVLIEYGYIYETKFQDEEILQKAAEQTYLGIKNFLTKK